MLDSVTKKRIDDCRDILVGKLPDPKAQIEQITIGLIYKFMDDMDKEAIELGGKAKFFADYKLPNPKNPKKSTLVEFSKYAWDHLMSPKVSAAEMLKLYSEAIEGMSRNPNIPQLFRDIFNNAYLPYRSPETLKLFLKTIGEFEYTHSEKLGDAFEYLLSVMGSQGDAGQFRTPRHIIDFLVKIVDPGKNDTILDPACGTAGFLISAYKHIKESNKKGLTPDERRKLMKNVVGYDISPDMVRLSRVNLYLHGFSEPHIYEYDTLSSEDRWNESYDVILANPPFMSPKGGIRPHKKFSIASNRSEVLFVDYIAEHLNPKGRAGIIVPEGVIFQSGTAYKDLRKMLVENYLYAVVSLPAGVFNPYSGVKTSILLMDKELAKKSKEILFVKIENDGYGLGAQRSPVKGSQLEEAVQIITKFRTGIDENKKVKDFGFGHAIAKTEIAKSGDYNLSGDRYKEQAKVVTDFPLLDFESSIEQIIYTTKIKNSDYQEKGKFPIVDQSDKFIAGYWNNPNDVFRITKPVTVFGDHTRCFKYIDFDFVLGADGVKILQPSDEYNPKFFFYLIRNIPINNLGYSRHYKELKDKKIPCPPLSVQEEIVAEIDGYQKIIDGARMVVENYKPRIEIDPSWEMVGLGTIGKICMCKRVFKEETQPEGDVPFYKIGTFGAESDAFISKELFDEYKSRFAYPKRGDVLISTSGTIGKIVVFDGKPAYFQDSNIVWIANDETKVSNEFLKILYTQIEWRPAEGVTIARLYNKIIEETIIPVPPLHVQTKIISEFESIQKLIEANRKLIDVYEHRIKKVINKVWQGEGKKYGEKERELGSDSYRMVGES